MGSDKKQTSSQKVATYGIMIALALVFGYIEHLIPFSVGIYGIKLGLANLVVIIMLYTVSTRGAFAVNIARIFLVGLLFGSAVSLIYSLTGGILSFFIMLLAKKVGKFSVVGISIIGGITHNMGQLLAAAIMLDQLKILFYLPVLLISGALAGTLIGIASLPIIKSLSKTN